MQRKTAKKKTKRANTSTDPVTGYARKVKAGKIVTGPHVRMACTRHLNDIKEQKKRGIVWDKNEALRVIGYFKDVLHLAGGEFEGKPFMLLDWECFVVGSLFGWKAADGFRRFRVGYIETAKGSGKSPLLAGIGLYMLTA